MFLDIVPTRLDFLMVLFHSILLSYGNIRSITSWLSGIENESYTLEYGNTSWIDRLTKVTYTDKNGNTSSGNLTYDRIGNPERYFNGHKTWDFTWKFGRQLTGASSGSSVISYAYDVDGIRQSKTVNGSTTKFTTLDGKVVRETWGNITTDYFYDNEGKPYKLEVAGSAMNFVGYYVLNQQGDVVAILDNTGDVVVTYEYNAWGKILDETGTGTLVSTYLKTYNRLKYRGYYHDGETGFYYLNSRYYDPVIGRFINADDIDVLSIEQGNLLQYNIYCYCLNNPVNYIDNLGESAILVFLGTAVAGAIVNIVTNGIAAAVTGQEFTFKDACVAGVAGGVNAIPYVGPLLNGLVSGGYAAYKSYSTGGNEMDAAISGVTAAFASIASVSNLARAGKVSLSILDASAIDFVNGIGANGMAAAAYQSVNYDNKRMAKASGKRTSNKSKGKSRKHQKPKSSALSENGGSIDYFIYLLNGGTAY